MTLLRNATIAVVAAIAAYSTGANAADLLVEQDVAPTVVGSTADWEGLYIGAAIGGIWADTAYDGPTINTSAETFDYEANGGLASLYAGYNWQIEDSFVVGVEGEVSWLDLAFDANRITVGVLGPWQYLSADWSGALSVRGGVLLTPDVLVYGKLGYSWTNFEMGSWGGTPVIDEGVVGAVLAGVGTEVKLTENVTLRGELAYNFAQDDVSASYLPDSIYTYTPSYGTAKVGLSFKF